MKIIILTRDIKDGEKLRNSLRIFDSAFENLCCFTKKEVLNKTTDLSDCEYIFSTWYMPNFTEEEIHVLFPSLKCVFYAAGTVKYFAEPLLRSGIRVFSAAKANGIPVAEYTAAQIILAGKGYYQAQRAYRWPILHRGFNRSRGYAERKYGNYGAKIGIIGCGAIGSKVVELLKPYHLDVYVYDPYLSEERANGLGVKGVDMEELFSLCDVVSNHLPDIPETKGLINERLLGIMKPTATFINTGRGAQVDEKSLNKFLKKRKDMCALLDVTSHEPLLPWSPLYWRKNVFLTPHIAGSLSEEFGRMVEYMVQAYHDVIKGNNNMCETSIEMLAKQSTH